MREDPDVIFFEEDSEVLEERARDKLKHVYKRRKVYKKRKEETKRITSPEGLGHKRPGTPTILTVMVFSQQGEKKSVQHQEVKNRKQKGFQLACAVRRRRKLEFKMHAKQPRAVY